MRTREKETLLQSRITMLADNIHYTSGMKLKHYINFATNRPSKSLQSTTLCLVTNPGRITHSIYSDDLAEIKHKHKRWNSKPSVNTAHTQVQKPSNQGLIRKCQILMKLVWLIWFLLKCNKVRKTNFKPSSSVNVHQHANASSLIPKQHEYQLN